MNIGQNMTVFGLITCFFHVILLHGNNLLTQNREESMGFWFKIPQFETALSRRAFHQLSPQSAAAVGAKQAVEKDRVHGDFMAMVDDRIDWAYGRMRKGTWKRQYGTKAEIAAYIDTFEDRMYWLRTWADWNFRHVLTCAAEGNRQAVYSASKIAFRYVDQINNEARPTMPKSWELLGSGIFIPSELPIDRGLEPYTKRT